MKPSSLSTRAISTFILETGTVQVRWLAAFALRMRVSMSAMVSLVIAPSLPGGLLHAGDLPDGGVLAEADAAHAELAHEGAGTAADAAPVMLLDAELGRSHRLGYQGLLCQLCLPHHAVSPRGDAATRDGRCHAACCPALRKGMLKCWRRARPSSSVFAVVTMQISMPRSRSILS